MRITLWSSNCWNHNQNDSLGMMTFFPREGGRGSLLLHIDDPNLSVLWSCAESRGPCSPH